jgi:hypothetical protein
VVPLQLHALLQVLHLLHHGITACVAKLRWRCPCCARC